MARPFQFSIRWIMVATAAVALGAWLCISDPSPWLGVVGVIIHIALPVLCRVAQGETFGGVRAFWLGVGFIMTLSAAGFFLILVVEIWGNPPGEAPPAWDGVARGLTTASCFLRMFVPFMAFAPLVGLLSAVFHRLVVRGKKSNEDR